MTDVGQILALLALLQLKHFVADFLYQPPWQYKNKGTFGHPGGLAHSGQHAVATFFILVFFTDPITAACLAIFEFWTHYLIDWAKMNLNAKLGWGPTTSENFWKLLGFDQLLHQLTYVIILLVVT